MNKLKIKINKLYYYIFGEKFFKKINFEWHKYPSRHNVIQDTIFRKKYKSYLEIGCFGAGELPRSEWHRCLLHIHISQELSSIDFS